MNDRERYIAVQHFRNVDRIPFTPGVARESTIKNWHGQGLPEGVDWLGYLCERIGMERPKDPESVEKHVDFRMIPQFEEKVIERRQGSLVVQDWKGNICEISDKYDVIYLREARDFVTRSWIKCPVENRDEWEMMKERYDPFDPARFSSDWEEWVEASRDREHILLLSFPGPFWQMREWLGFEELCIRFLTESDMIADMVGFWADFVEGLLVGMTRSLVPDVVIVSEDMAYKEKAMISPALVREFLLPVWRRWGKILKDAGCPVYGIDSDGYVGELIPLWIEAGFDTNWPVEVAAGNDLPGYRRIYGERMAYLGGVDKRAMAKGGEDIAAELARLEPVLRGGGYIPQCDHGIPPDVSWPAMLEYSKILARMTGWI